MLKNYIKTAWRSLKNNRVFSLINIFGLSVGLTCCMLITAYVYSELNYDRYADGADRIYRVGLRAIENNGINDYPMVDMAVGRGIKDQYPEVAEATRLSGRGPVFVKYGQKQFKEEHIQLIDGDSSRVWMRHLN